jgi:hypothetical protein
MTVSACIEYCSASPGYSYAGLEFGRECFCANALDPRYTPKDGIMGNCNYKCSGNSTEICGGYAAMSIYHKCDVGSCKNVVIGGGSGAKVRRHARQLGV